MTTHDRPLRGRGLSGRVESCRGREPRSCAYEDCHTGAFGNVPIKLIASKLAGCAGHGRACTQLHYVFADGSPWAGVPADMKTSGYI